MSTLIAKGTTVFTTAPVEGVLHELSSPQEVLALVDGGATDVIALVHKQGATFLGPLLPAMSGIVCTSGTPRSHLGIVAREWQIACLMGAELTGPTPANGARVRLDCSTTPGTLTVL